MEQVKNEIKKAVIKKDRLNVVYNERFSEANYTNVINKSCDQIIHSDLREAFSRLKLHLVVLCEQPEASNINKDSFTSPGYAETLENYIKRLTKLEDIAKSFSGVDSCYAIQAGRELRVIVKPEKVSEDQATILSHDISRRIEKELQYPGQVKVVVIRETRATDFAK